VPPALDLVIARCLEKDRRQRYRSAVELHHELRRCRAMLATADAGAPAATAPRRGRLNALLRRIFGSG
jgi:hypothetical protein